jgi:uncharacterized protein YjdB
VYKRTLILAVTGFAFGVAACGSYGTSVVEGNKPPAHVASVALTVPVSLITGQSVRAVAVAKDASGATLPGRAVSWFTSSPAIASVTDSGLVSAVAPGSAILSAVSEGISGQATIGVMPPTPTPVATVTVAVSPPSVLIGQIAHATATLKDSTGAQLVGRTVSWLSSNANIARVASTGDVTAVAPGTAMISASSEGKTATSALNVTAPPPVPVFSVSVSPANDTIQVGQTAPLTVVTRDANGAVLSGRVVTWSSTNTAIASVNATSGVVTGVAAGAVQINASSESKIGSAAFTITAVAPPPPPPPPGSYNEPAGMTVISQRPFSAMNEAGWADNGFTIVQDPTAPISPPNVMRATFPAGFVAGSAPGLAYITTGNYHTMYIRFAAKLSTNWYGQASGFCKYFYEWVRDPNDEAFFFSSHGTGTAPLDPYVILQGIVGSPGGSFWNLAPNLAPSARIIRGQWQIYEFVLTGNSAGQADGMVDWWLDGVHVGHDTGIQWTTTATTFTEFDFRPVWGGIGPPNVPATQTMDWDDVYLSGKY